MSRGPVSARSPLMRTIILSLAMVLALAACRRETVDEDMAAATATTETTATNTSTISATTTGSTGGSVSTMSPSDKEFVIQAAYSGAAEVAAGLIGVSAARNQTVRNFAQRMVTDHGRNNEELQKLATAKGLALPTALADEHQEAVDRLQDTAGADFDRAFMQQMVAGHQKAVAMFEAAERTVEDVDLRAWIGRTLPVLRDHLKMAQSIRP